MLDIVHLLHHYHIIPFVKLQALSEIILNLFLHKENGAYNHMLHKFLLIKVEGNLQIL